MKKTNGSDESYEITCPSVIIGEIEGLNELSREMLTRLLMAAEYRDDETGKHVVRVGKYARIIASRLGYAGQFLDFIENAAAMHDIGKIGVPDDILLKPARLTKEEFEKMKKHTIIGGRLLGGSKFPLFKMSWEIAVNHHEKWDGTGYPRGIKGDDIPVVGRIAAVADVFDALTSKRPYKPPYPFGEAATMAESWKGKHFDPAAVEAFLSSLGAIRKIYDELCDRCSDVSRDIDPAEIEEKR